MNKKTNKKKNNRQKVIKSLYKATKKVILILLLMACVALSFKKNINLDFKVMPDGSFSISLEGNNKDSF